MDDGSKAALARIGPKPRESGSVPCDDLGRLTAALKAQFDKTAQEPLPERLKSLMAQLRAEETSTSTKLNR